MDWKKIDLTKLTLAPKFILAEIWSVKVKNINKCLDYVEKN